VAWHILCALAREKGYPVPSSYEDEFPLNDPEGKARDKWLDFAFFLQLTPEMAEDIAAYERVCFIDAHTGNIPREVQMILVESEFQRSPFTHHLTPQSLLSMCENLYHKKPDAALVSVRGYRFGFERELSAETGALVPEAVGLITKWLDSPPVN
jgi:Ni,Fe-hydrogenase maturation factor